MLDDSCRQLFRGRRRPVPRGNRTATCRGRTATPPPDPSAAPPRAACAAAGTRSARSGCADHRPPTAAPHPAALDRYAVGRLYGLPLINQERDSSECEVRSAVRSAKCGSEFEVRFEVQFEVRSSVRSAFRSPVREVRRAHVELPGTSNSTSHFELHSAIRTELRTPNCISRSALRTSHFALRTPQSELLINRPGVDDWLSTPFAAEHDEQ